MQLGKITGKQLKQPPYYAGLLLKINLKLGGVNVISPKSMGGLTLLREKPTIVFGVDVNHAAPNSFKPSYYALTATMDEECAKYFTIVGSQRSRQEGMGGDTFKQNVRVAHPL